MESPEEGTVWVIESFSDGQRVPDGARHLASIPTRTNTTVNSNQPGAVGTPLYAPDAFHQQAVAEVTHYFLVPRRAEMSSSGKIYRLLD